MSHYFERNRLWLNALLAGFIISVAPLLLAIVDPTVAVSLPKWINVTALILSGFGVGLGAMLTDTSSAKVVRFLGSAFAIAVIAYNIF